MQDSAVVADAEHQVKIDRGVQLMQDWAWEDLLAGTVELLAGPSKK